MKISSMADELRVQRRELGALRDSDFRAIVQSMIATGKLSYASGLKIKLADTSE